MEADLTPTQSAEPEMVEHIVAQNSSLAYIVRRELNPRQTTFLTPPDCTLQTGFVAYPAGGEIRRHVHKPLQREISGTMEVIIVRKGCCMIDVYDETQVLVASRELRTDDVVIITNGGHGFRMLEDTVLLEVKQGPYFGVGEKDWF